MEGGKSLPLNRSEWVLCYLETFSPSREIRRIWCPRDTLEEFPVGDGGGGERMLALLEHLLCSRYCDITLIPEECW